jgi:hypothetical protein
LTDQAQDPEHESPSAGTTQPESEKDGASKHWFEVARDRLNENFIYATIVAALILQRELILMAALLVISLAVVLFELWRARSGDYEPGGVVAAAVKKAVGFVTSDSWVQRIAAGSVVVLVVGGGMTYMTWRTVDGALANSHMRGDVNVLIATFHDQNTDESDASGPSRQVSQWLEAALIDEFAPEIDNDTVAVQLVDEVISGSQERANAAVMELGEKYAADVVLFGDVLEKADGTLYITPRYTFTGRQGGDLSGVEIAGVTGSSALGEAIGPVDLEASGTQLSARSGLIVQFLTGLVSLLQERPDASEHFRAAIASAEGQGLPPNEFLYYFLGSALLLEHIPDSYSQAKTAFETALQLQPSYARAQIGLANTLYLQATLASPADHSILAQAAMLYEGALAGLDDEESAVLQASGRIGLGHVYASLAKRDPEMYRADARRQYAIAAGIDDGCGQGKLGWWDPRGWGPWSDRFDAEPASCPQLLRLGTLAETLIDELENVIRAPLTSPVPAGSAPGVATVSVGSASGSVGKVVTTPVTVLYGESPGLGAWEVSLLYDPILLDVAECVTGTASAVCNPELDEVTLRIVGASATGLVGDTLIAEISFKCEEAGETTLEVRVDVLADATTGGPRPITFSAVPGTVTCTP